MTVQLDLLGLLEGSDLDEITDVILGHWCAPALVDAPDRKARRAVLDGRFYDGGGGWGGQGRQFTVEKNGVFCRSDGVETLYRWAAILQAVEAAATAERRDAIRAAAEIRRRERATAAEEIRLKATIYPDGTPVPWTSPAGVTQPGWRCWHCGASSPPPGISGSITSCSVTRCASARGPRVDPPGGVANSSKRKQDSLLNRRTTYLLAASFVAYVGTVVAANWAITTFGVISIGFGLSAPAGVLFAGLAFTLRDSTQEEGGSKIAAAAVLVGALISYLIGAGGQAVPGAVLPVAAASAVAFLVSELSDLLVYTALRRRGFLLSVFASNVVGLAVDSITFLLLAFGSLDYLAGQIVGKAYMTAAAVLLILLARRRRGRAVSQSTHRVAEGA